MTIDERLEKLAERHEALAETVQTMATEGIRLQKLVERHDRRFELMREDTQSLKDLLEADRHELHNEARKRGQELDEWIEKLVIAIGRIIPKGEGA